MERRTFLGGLTAASFGVLLEDSFADPAQTKTGAKFGSPGFFRDVSCGGFRKHNFRAPLWKRTGNSSGARLSAHKLDVAIPEPKLAENHTVICVDLRAVRPQRDTRFY